jgi:transcription termination factor NusB
MSSHLRPSRGDFGWVTYWIEHQPKFVNVLLICELIDLVKEESAKESFRNINCILTIVESLGGK